MYKDISSHFTLYKRGPYWGYYWYDEGNKRHFRSTGRKTKHEAMRVITERIRQGQLAYSRSGSMLFKDFAADMFIEGKCPVEAEKIKLGRHTAVTTLQKYRSILTNDWVPAIGDSPLDMISRDMILKCRLSMTDGGNSRQTANLKMTVLRVALDHAVSSGILRENPVAGIKPLASDAKMREAFTEEDIRLLLAEDWGNGVYRDIFITSCMTGMRLGELLALRVCDVYEDHIEVSRSKAAMLDIIKDTKNHKTRIIPASSTLKDLLDPYMEGKGPDDIIFTVNSRAISHKTVERALKSAKERAGIKGEKTFHSARHFFDSSLYLKSGVDKERIKAVMGHSGDDMFRHYLHINESSLDPVRKAQDAIYDRISDNKTDDTQED